MLKNGFNYLTVRDIIILAIAVGFMLQFRMLNKNFVDLNQSFVSLNQSFDGQFANLMATFVDLNQSVVSLNQSVVKNFGQLNSKFRKSHDFGVDRVSYAKSISYKLDTGSSLVTSFGVYYEGMAFDVTVSHMFVSLPEVGRNLIACPKLDIALSRSCPRLHNVLNGSKYTDQRAGDQVVIYGFSSMQSSYTGTLAGTWNLHEVDFDPFQGNSNIPEKSLIITGANQDGGLSGSTVFNGLGIVGVVVASKINNSSVAVAIPWESVLQCANAMRGSLQRADNCNINVTSPPDLSSNE